MPNDLQQCEENLASLAASGATVTITRTDGRILTGSLKDHPTEPRAYVVMTGRRGRPAVIWPEDVEEVTAE